MIYCIMCGGEYTEFEQPRPFIEICGERLIDRTLRLLKENGTADICITSNDPRFDGLAERLEHQNSYRAGPDIGQEGCWLDAFYPDFPENTQVTFLYGDVWYSEEAMETIVSCTRSSNVLFGTGIAKNKAHRNWGEPFAYRVTDYKTFMQGVEDVKELWRAGKVERNPITWELYRYLNGFDVNVQMINDDTYIVIDDLTMDVDAPNSAWMIEKKVKAVSR